MIRTNCSDKLNMSERWVHKKTTPLPKQRGGSVSVSPFGGTARSMAAAHHSLKTQSIHKSLRELMGYLRTTSGLVYAMPPVSFCAACCATLIVNGCILSGLGCRLLERPYGPRVCRILRVGYTYVFQGRRGRSPPIHMFTHAVRTILSFFLVFPASIVGSNRSVVRR